MKNLYKAITILLLTSSFSAIANEEIGNFWRAKKTTVDTQTAKRGDSFKLNQLIETGKSSRAKAEVLTIDDSRYILYKNSSIIFEDLKLSGGKCEGLKVTLNQGKLRGTSGKCGHGKTEIVTTVASAFAWGTDYEMVFIPEDNKPQGYENTPTGFYQKVNEGKVLVKNSFGSLLVNPGEVGYVASLTDAPVVIEAPAFFTNTSKSKKKDNKNNKTTQKTTQKTQSSSSSNKGTVKNYVPIAASDEVVEIVVIDIQPETVADIVEENEEECYSCS